MKIRADVNTGNYIFEEVESRIGEKTYLNYRIGHCLKSWQRIVVFFEAEDKHHPNMHLHISQPVFYSLCSQQTIENSSFDKK